MGGPLPIYSHYHHVRRHGGDCERDGSLMSATVPIPFVGGGGVMPPSPPPRMTEQLIASPHCGEKSNLRIFQPRNYDIIKLINGQDFLMNNTTN